MTWLEIKENVPLINFLERVFALFLLILFSPIMLFAAALIKLTSYGPAFYSQMRVGRNGNYFDFVKLRTMKIDAELNGPQWSSGDKDPRITWVGYWLRKTHIDELPQLLHIVQGEMSFVGPRPERPDIVTRLLNYYDNYNNRHIVKPGITGLAQVRFRAEKDISDTRIKLGYDLFYIKKASFCLDLKIILWTALKIFGIRHKPIKP